MQSSGADAVEISIIVPTVNEAENLPALLERIDAALRPRSYEVLIVDDQSRDRTPEVCRRLAERYPVDLLVRSDLTGGLSGAVLLGLSRARGQFLLVMDADLQHPPERIPDLLAPLASGQADFVLGSRYVAGGSTAARWGIMRKFNSRIATWLARPFAAGARDPMSGFFALTRETYSRAERPDPVGYKIALELMCKCRARRVVEVPIHFAVRGAGTSKLTVRQQLRYLDHLSRLYDFCFPRRSAWVKFVLSTACAWLAGFALYGLLVAHDVGPLWAPIAAFSAAVGMSAAFYARSLRTRGLGHSIRAWADFGIGIAAEWAVCAIVASFVVSHVAHVSAMTLFALTFGAAAGARFALRVQFLHDLRGVRARSGPSELAARLPRPTRDVA